MKSFYLLLLILVISSCLAPKLPTTKIKHYEYTSNYTIEEDTLKVSLGNPLSCPLRIWVISSDSNAEKFLTHLNSILLKPKSDTSLNPD